MQQHLVRLRARGAAAAVDMGRPLCAFLASERGAGASTSQHRAASSTARSIPSGDDEYDVVIMGGGMVGLALAGEIGEAEEVGSATFASRTVDQPSSHVFSPSLPLSLSLSPSTQPPAPSPATCASS